MRTVLALTLLAGLASPMACHAPPGAPATAAPSKPTPSGLPPTEPTPTEPGSSHRAHHHSAGMHHDFSDVERFARLFDDPDRDAWQRPSQVIAQLGLEPGDAVVDLGTGTGYFVPHLSRAVGPSGVVWALDVEPKMVEHVRKRARDAGLDNVRARSVAPDDPGLAPGSVACVLIVDTWHHVDDREAYASRLARALRPGGAVWVVDFTPESDLGPPPRHRLPAERVRAELEAGGLEASVVLEADLPKQYLVRGRKPR